MLAASFRKSRAFVLICIFTCLAGVMFQLINEQRVTYQSVLVGFPLGMGFALLEIVLFPKAEKRLRSWSFSGLIVFKIVAYTAVIYAVSILLMVLAGIFEGRTVDELLANLASKSQLVLVIYTLAMYSLLVIFLQFNRLLGDGVLEKFIGGKYHRPREEERIFMFLDMKSSTTIAERLGHIRFYQLLDELFHEVSNPALETKAEIYQYVGDEVVLTWLVNDGVENANCIKTFFLFKERLQQNSERYIKQYEVQPEFKAAIHCGKVVSAQIGDLKRQIIYNGDVLNTTARMRDECNRYQRDCLISGTLMEKLKMTGDFQFVYLDAVALRGKETEVEMYSVDKMQPDAFNVRLPGGQLADTTKYTNHNMEERRM